MSDAPSIETLLGAATQAESKRDGDSLYAFAQVARQAGALALSLSSARLARQRGYVEPPDAHELELLFRFEQLEPLVDLAIEFNQHETLQRMVLAFGGHPDLHRHGVAAADALASMMGVAPALPARRAEPELDDYWEALLAGDTSLVGWGIRRFGAPVVDRMMRLASRGIEALVNIAALAPAWVEVHAGKAAALPYYRYAYQHRLGDEEHQRQALVMCAALTDREQALEVCRDEHERVALAQWVLGRPTQDALDARWLRFLDDEALSAFAEAEGERWLAGEPARIQIERICSEPRLAASFQPWFMAMGDFPAVLQCIQSRCRIAERSERVGLERSAAEMLEHLGRHDEAVDHAAQALLLAPDEQSSFELVHALGQAHPGCRRRASDHLRAAAVTSGRIDWALKSLTLLADEPRRARALELILNQFSVDQVLEAFDALEALHAELGPALFKLLSDRGALDADRVVGFVRSQLPALSQQTSSGDYQPLLDLLERHADEDDRSQRLRIPILLELGRAEEALEALDAAGLPDRGSWAVLRARAHWHLGASQEARRLLQAAVESGNRAAVELLESLEAGDL